MKTILVALDTSPRAEGVLREADALAARTGAKLAVLHCVRLPPELPASLWTSPPERILEQICEGARIELENFARAIPKERFLGVTVQVGVPWREICAAASEPDVDLVVIGAHGYGTLDRVLGTTAAKVVNHVEKNVLVVRPKDTGRSTS